MSTVNPLAPAADSAFDVAAQLEAQQAAQAQAILDEEEEVGRWLKKIEDAREFDKSARVQYAIDRTYVGGEAGRGNFDVTVNIAGTYVDILVAFLYARDPAADVLPADSCGPSRLEMARLLGKTMEIVVAKTWKKAKLKAAARPMVRSSLSVAIGWMKAAWHERTGSDPTTATKIADLQDNLARLQAAQTELASGEAEDPDVLRISIEAQIEALQANVEKVVSRGLVIDYVSAEDVQIAPECARLENYLDAPWIAHRTFMPLDDAKAAYPAIAELLKSANLYQQVKPRDPAEKTEAGGLSNATAEDADSFRSGESLNSKGTLGPQHVCVWEVQHRDSNCIYTLIEGVKRWARPPAAPRPATTRFYSLFQWAPLQVDGKRHPESLPKRSVELLDEYNRVRSNKREHRRRAIPKLGFNKRAVDAEQARKLEAGAIGEMVGLDVMGDDPKNVVWPIQYNNIDPALYDTSEIRAELEMIWGIQEALSSSIHTAKTLGEAEIQQTGTEARQGFKRDSMEEMFTDLAQYTAEIALQEYTDEDVRTLAGPEAFWPGTEDQKLGVEDLETLVNVDIRAGSSGKPNTSLRQQQWSQLIGPLKEAIQYLAQLRMSSPLDVANCIEEMVKETLERAGDRLDPERFLPKQGNPVMLIDPNTMQPVLAYPAPNQPAPPPAAAGPPVPGAPNPSTGGAMPPGPAAPIPQNSPEAVAP